MTLPSTVIDDAPLIVALIERLALSDQLELMHFMAKLNPEFGKLPAVTQWCGKHKVLLGMLAGVKFT